MKLRKIRDPVLKLFAFLPSELLWTIYGLTRMAQSPSHRYLLRN
eukprot:COSAG05_NODE_8808_length_669_cov_5.580702_1_plen_43_part_10